MAGSINEVENERPSWLPSRRWRLFLGFVLLIGCGWGIYILTLKYPGRNIHQANFERIKPSMTKQAVIEILGPPGKYLTKPFPYVLGTNKECKYSLQCDHVEVWMGDLGIIAIGFDESNRVVARLFHGPEGGNIQFNWR